MFAITHKEEGEEVVTTCEGYDEYVGRIVVYVDLVTEVTILAEDIVVIEEL
jgi:hypothetical protein